MVSTWHVAGSTDWSIVQNVFSDAVACADNCEWLHIWTGSIHGIRVATAWSDTRTLRNDGTNCTVTNVTYIDEPATFPADAKAIMTDAGPTTRFAPWSRPPPPPPPLWLPMAMARRAPACGELPYMAREQTRE